MANKRVTTIEWGGIDEETRGIMRTYNKRKNTPWTKEESGYMASLVITGMAWKLVASILNTNFHSDRTVYACEARFRSLSNV